MYCFWEKIENVVFSSLNSVESLVLRKLKKRFTFDVGFHTESAIFSTILSLLLKDEIRDFSIPGVYQVTIIAFLCALDEKKNAFWKF